MPATKHITIPRKGMQTYEVQYFDDGKLKRVDVYAYPSGIDAEFERLTGIVRKHIYKRIKK